MQGEGLNPLEILIKVNKEIIKSTNQLNSGWCHTVIQFQLYVYVYINICYVFDNFYTL